MRARLNTRPPAEAPYSNIGAGVAPAVLSSTQREQQALLDRMLLAHPSSKASAPDKTQVTTMSNAVKRTAQPPSQK